MTDEALTALHGSIAGFLVHIHEPPNHVFQVLADF
jgi:hypothetical protein